eukprot:scaffold77399_cov76-Phaeocystis_antarctica.AAC.11
MFSCFGGCAAPTGTGRPLDSAELDALDGVLVTGTALQTYTTVTGSGLTASGAAQRPRSVARSVGGALPGKRAAGARPPRAAPAWVRARFGPLLLRLGLGLGLGLDG